MLHFKFPSIILMGVLGLVTSSSASAWFTVEQYDDYTSTDIIELIDYANNNQADTISEWDTIDFTDYTSGVSGDVAGSSVWPSALSSENAGSYDAINETFFVKVSGVFSVEDAGEYLFQTYSDDGVFLFIDGELVIDDPNLHSSKRLNASITLSEGLYDIELFYFENTGIGSLELTYSSEFSSELQLVRSVSGFTTSEASLVNDVPEPTSAMLFAMGFWGLTARRSNSTKTS